MSSLVFQAACLDQAMGAWGQEQRVDRRGGKKEQKDQVPMKGVSGSQEKVLGRQESIKTNEPGMIKSRFSFLPYQIEAFS
jgi:hypothetical protein